MDYFRITCILIKEYTTQFTWWNIGFKTKATIAKANVAHLVECWKNRNECTIKTEKITQQRRFSEIIFKRTRMRWKKNQKTEFLSHKGQNWREREKKENNLYMSKRKISLTQRETFDPFCLVSNSVENLFRLRIMCIMKLPVI